MTEIRSYRAVFDLERRIYRVDGLRLNPNGVPLRGLVYFMAILAVVIVLGRLPLLDVPVRMFPWYLREVAAPVALAALLTLIKIEGRPAHWAALTLLRFAFGPREMAGLRRRVPADRRLNPHGLVLLADGSDARLRRLRYRGPGTVRASVAHVRATRHLGRFGWWVGRPSVVLAPLPGMRPLGRTQTVALIEGACLEVHSQP